MFKKITLFSILCLLTFAVLPPSQCKFSCSSHSGCGDLEIEIRGKKSGSCSGAYNHVEANYVACDDKVYQDTKKSFTHKD